MKNNIPSPEMVEWLRTQYPKGTRVELVSMNDPYNTKLKPGDQGSVICTDDVGTLHVQWDCGSSLGVVWGVDCVKKL